MQTFYSQIFNPQYVNAEYYRQIQYQQYQAKQNKEVEKAVRAIHDLCEAVKQMDGKHKQIAFNACLTEFAQELQ